MKIACLGWGSLVWDPRGLPVGNWFEDGPILPIEFARQSNDGRLTLVLVQNYPTVRSLWALFVGGNLADAMEKLSVREGTNDKQNKYIESWSKGSPTRADFPEISNWATRLDLDAVVWTGLPIEPDPRRDESASVTYLDGLKGTERARAEEYVRKAPRQIDTPYRRRFEKDLGWTPLP